MDARCRGKSVCNKSAHVVPRACAMTPPTLDMPLTAGAPLFPVVQKRSRYEG